MSRSQRSPFPYVPLGPTELHTEPGPTWDRMLSDIAGARSEIQFENYIFVDGVAAEYLLEALAQAKSQGARIRLFLDGAGSYEMSQAMLRRLQQVGEVKIYHPLRWKTLFFQFRSNFMRRTHRRMVLVDGVIAWTGGMAVEDPWWKDAVTPFREAMIRLCGPVVQQFQKAFDTMWSEEPELPSVKQRPIQADQVRALPQQARRLSHFRFALLYRIGRSHQRAWIATAYFIPPRRLRRALIHAAERGVDVRLLLPGPRLHDHPASRFASRRYYAQLLRHGVKIYEYQPSFQHAKACLFDDHLCIIGTPNIDRWSNLWNHEISVDMHATEINQQLAESFEKGFAESHHITYPSWKARPLWNRFLEYFFGIFDKAF